jgi:glycosyltransferase involved in cell wall biosynthesis
MSIEGTVDTAYVGALATSGEPLRILHVAEAFGGGLYEVVRALANDAAKRGHEVTVLYGRRPETPDDPEPDFSARVTLEPMPWGGRSPFEQLRAMRRLRAAAKEFAPDVIHLHSSFAAVFGGVALRGLAPIVYTPHSFASCLPSTPKLRRRLLVAGERLAIRCATAVGAVSESEARCSRRRGASDVTVIPNGITELNVTAQVRRELERLARPRIADTRVIAGGRIVGQRQPDACARILGALGPDVETRWAGGGGDDTPWAEEARRALRDAGVEITGWLPREEWLRELDEATVYLHWTAWDGLPLCLLEALAEDTIVVASDIAPNREVLSPEQLCASEDEAVALLQRIVAEPAFAARLRSAQRERRQRYSETRMARQWSDLYARLAGRPELVPAVPSRPENRVELERALTRRRAMLEAMVDVAPPPDEEVEVEEMPAA